MEHTIPDTAKNSDLEYLIDEYVRLERDRAILREHWFQGLSFYQISDRHGLSLTTVKKIIYGIGDKILLRLN